MINYLRFFLYLFLSELRSVGVRVRDSSSGYYLFPDFEVCKAGLVPRGVRTADEFCRRMLDEAKVAVSSNAIFHESKRVLLFLQFLCRESFGFFTILLPFWVFSVFFAVAVDQSLSICRS